MSDVSVEISSALAAGPPLSTPAAAAAELAAGEAVIILDDRDPGHFAAALALAAEHVSAGSIAHLRRWSLGWLCLALTGRRCEELGLAPLAADGAMPMIDAAAGIGNGIDPADQARTILAAIDPGAAPGAVVSPGHVKVLRAADPHRDETGYVEAAVGLARAADLAPAAVVGEILGSDGFTAGPAEVARLCRRHELPAVAASAVASQAREEVVERVTRVTMPTVFGQFELVGYRSLLDDSEHLAMVKGEVSGAPGVLVHVHERCLAGDVFHALGCGCGERLDRALAAIEAAGSGVVVYDARSRDTGPVHGARAPQPDQEAVAAILADLGPVSIRVLGGGAGGLDGYGLPVER